MCRSGVPKLSWIRKKTPPDCRRMRSHVASQRVPHDGHWTGRRPPAVVGGREIR